MEQRYTAMPELVHAARILAARHPGAARLRQVGRSRAGRPLHLLSVGGAPRAVLVVAGAHANEPAGGSTLLHLAERTVGEPALRAGASWHFLLCADPDGAALHGTPTPRTLLDYHRLFYRPAGPEQPEWSPSLLPQHRLPPETRVLTGVIDELRPYLQVSLHGTELGGSWVQLTRDVPGLAEPFGKSAAQLNIPVEVGAADAAGWPAAGPGVHVMPAADADAAFPSLPDDARRSTWHHAHRYGGLTAVVEVPMWASDLVGDVAPHPAPARELRRLAARLRADVGRVEEILHLVLPRLPGSDAALLRAARWTLSLAPGLADDWTRPQPPGATVAYVSSIDAFGRRVPLRAAAMLLRILHATGDRAAPRLEELVTGWCEDFAAYFRARWVPIEHQVAHQAGTVLAAARLARAAR